MATILRDRAGSGYSVRYDKAPLEKVANSERFFPKDWIAPSRIDVTDDFLDYARPLIGEDWVSVPRSTASPGSPGCTRCSPPRTPRVHPADLPARLIPTHERTDRDRRHRPDRPRRHGRKPRPEHGEPRLHRRRLQPHHLEGRRLRRTAAARARRSSAPHGQGTGRRRSSGLARS